MEAAARRALHYGRVSYRSIERILREKEDRLPLEGMGAPTGREPLGHGNVRGGSYYRTSGSREGRGGDEC